MPASRGYRSDRLRRRRRSRVERSQAWLLYVLAAAVAFAAVLGAWYVAGRLSEDEPAVEKSGFIAAMQLTAPGEDDPVAALLVVQDPSGGDPGVFFVPPDLLLEGPNGEYVFAADAMAAGDLTADLERVINVPVDAVFTVPVSDLSRWAGTEELQVTLEQPVSVDVDGDTLVLEGDASVAAADLPAVFVSDGADRSGLAALQAALVQAALDAAALRPEGERRRLTGPSPAPSPRPALADVVGRATSGKATVELFPSSTRVAEGQFAFVPNPEEIQAAVTRRSPAFDAAVTVQVLNGSGRVGVGDAVVQRLAQLDVNLPAPRNADSFSYAQTQILAGPETLPVARDIRAILGRGVVLDGQGLPEGTVHVIVGDDFKAQESGTKDQP
jgi:hypothetical protein